MSADRLRRALLVSGGANNMLFGYPTMAGMAQEPKAGQEVLSHQRHHHSRGMLVDAGPTDLPLAPAFGPTGQFPQVETPWQQVCWGLFETKVSPDLSPKVRAAWRVIAHDEVLESLAAPEPVAAL